jgi:hypothetical protein
LSKNQTVGRVIAGLELIAGAIAVGALIAEAISELHKPKTDKKNMAPAPPLTESEDPLIRKNWIEVGKAILHEMPTKEQSLSEHLKRQYLGLYLIGRCGERLGKSDVERLAKDLRHFHHQLNRQEDWGLCAWYETVGTSHKISLSERLGYCPEIIELRVDEGHIAYAFGEDEDGLEFGDPSADFTKLQDQTVIL